MISDTMLRKIQEKIEVLNGDRGDKKRRAVLWSDLSSKELAAIFGNVATPIVKEIVKQNPGSGGGDGGDGGGGEAPPPDWAEQLEKDLAAAEQAAKAAAERARAANAKAGEVEDALNEAVEQLMVDYQKAIDAARDSAAALSAVEAAKSDAIKAADESAASRAAADLLTKAAQAAERGSVAAQSEADKRAKAAAGSAELATTKADDAGKESAAARAARLLAEQDSAAAKEWSNASAAASKTAEGHAATATQQSGIAATASHRALMETVASLPATFEGGGKYWTSSQNGTPDSMGPLSGVVTFGNDAAQGDFISVPSTETGQVPILAKGTVPYVAGATWRLTVVLRIRGNGVPLPNLVRFRASYMRGDHSYGAYSTPNGSIPFTAGAGSSWREFSYDWKLSASSYAKFLRFGALIDGSVDQKAVEIAFLKIEDVTAQIAAADSAEASSGHAATALSRANAAGVSAEASEASNQSAKLEAGASERSRVAAVKAQDEALKSATSANDNLTLASSMVARGQGVLSDPYMAKVSGGGWRPWGGTVLQQPNAHYAVGRSWSIANTAGQQSGIQISSSDTNSIWEGPVDAPGYVVEVEFTLENGVIDGAGILLDWTTRVAGYRTQLPLAEMAGGNVALGRRTIASGIFVRPGDVSGDFSKNHIYLMGSYGTLGSTQNAKRISIHRVTIRVAMAEEMGRGKVEAAFKSELQQNYLTKADTESAIAGASTILRASLMRKAASDDFSDGPAAWTDQNAGDPTLVRDYPANGNWSFVNATVSGSTVRQAQFDTAKGKGGDLNPKGVVPVKQGDIVRARVRYWVNNRGTGGQQGIGFRFSWLDASYSLVDTTYGFSDAIGGTYEVDAEKAAVAGAVYVRVGVYIRDSVYSTSVLTNWTYIRIENVSSVRELEATIRQDFITKVAADQAIAAGLTEFNAKVPGGLTATVTAQATAISNLNKTATSAYVLRAAAGQGSASIKLVAWDDERGAGSAIKLAGDNIIAEGSLSAEALTIGTGRNMLHNSNFAHGLTHFDPVVSGTAGAQSDHDIRPAGQAWAGSRFPTLMIFQNGNATSGWASFDAKPVIDATGEESYGYPVASGMWIEVSAALSAHRCDAALELQFLDLEGKQVGGAGLVAVNSGNTHSSVNPEGWPRIGGKREVPVGAYYAMLRIQKRPTRAGSANSYMFLYQPQLCVTHASATELAPYSPDGTTYVDGGSVIAQTMSANAIGTGLLNARFVEVTDRLTLQQNASLVYGKGHVADPKDGIFFGLTDRKFGFSVSRTDGSFRQSVDLTHDNFRILNARFARTGDNTVLTIPFSQSASRRAVAAGTRQITLQGVGGGGSGNDGSGSRAGGATTIRLYDGNTLKHTLTCAGGAGGGGGSVRPLGHSDGHGRGSYYGDNVGRYSAGSVPGGGGGGSKASSTRVHRGGQGGVFASSGVIDISGWSNPQIEVSIGAGGAALSGGAGSGAAGYAEYFASGYVEVPADVVPMVPTESGTFRRSGSGTFPDFGPGIWLLWSQTTMTMRSVTISPNRTMMVWGMFAVLVASQTPTWTDSGSGNDIEYHFFSMANWK